MGTPTISNRFYNTTLSAAQNASRCIAFTQSSLTFGSLLHDRYTVNSIPEEGETFSIDGIVYTFVSGTAQKDTEIQIQLTTEDTAAHLWNCLNGSVNYPVYEFNTFYSGTNSFEALCKRLGSKYNKQVNTASAPSITYTVITAGEDASYLPNYKIVIDLLVNSSYFSTIYLSPTFKHGYLTRAYLTKLKVNLNAVLKDAVYTEDPETGYSGINLLDTVSKSVDLRIYETYDGFNGYESGDILTVSDGRILNSRGLVVSLNGIQNDEDYNDLATDYCPSSSNHPVKPFIEKPVSGSSIEFCRNTPFYYSFYLPEEYSTDIYSYVELILPVGAPVEILFASFFQGEGVYNFNLGALALAQGIGNGQEFGIGVKYDDGTPPPAEGDSYYLIEPYYFTMRSDCHTLCSCSNTFAFLNKFGVYETIITSCDSKVDRDIFENIAEQCVDCSEKDLLLLQQTTSQATRRVSNKGYSEKRTVYIDIDNSDESIEYLKSFLYSSKVFVLSEDGSVWIPCKINTKTRTLSTSKSTLKVRIQYERFFPKHSVMR